MNFCMDSMQEICSIKAELYLANPMPPTDRISPRITADHAHLTCGSCLAFPAISHFRTFCTFSHFFFAGVNCHKTYWYLAGQRWSASDPEILGRLFSVCFFVFTQKTRMENKTEKNVICKIATVTGLLGSLLGAPGASFSRTLKFEKPTFPEKGPKPKTLATFPILPSFGSKTSSLDFRGPQIFEQKYKHVDFFGFFVGFDFSRNAVFPLLPKGLFFSHLRTSKRALWNAKNAKPPHQILQKIHAEP
jgi:hypothetical protein